MIGNVYRLFADSQTRLSTGVPASGTISLAITVGLASRHNARASPQLLALAHQLTIFLWFVDLLSIHINHATRATRLQYCQQHINPFLRNMIHNTHIATPATVCQSKLIIRTRGGHGCMSPVTVGQFLSRPCWCSPGFPYSAPGPLWRHPSPRLPGLSPLVNSWLCPLIRARTLG